MRTLNTHEIADCVYRLARKAGLSLTDSCRTALKSAANLEDGAAAFALDSLLENEVTAKREEMPVCQDTGLSVVLIELGQEVHLEGAPLFDAVNDGVRRAYADGNFRKSVCDPLTRVNTGDNTPAHLHVEIVNGDKVSVTFLPKGFGSENMSALRMFTPSAKREDIIGFIVDTVKKAGSNPCPPVVIGVGIGGDFEYSAILAKKALCRCVSKRNDIDFYREMEAELLEKINALDIGPQGFGGKTTALAVNIETYPTHIAGLPVAVNVGCHVTRHAQREI